MIIFLGNGRLGNQLFQYSFLLREFPEELAILIGFDEVAELCEMNNKIIIPKRYFGKIAYRFFRDLIALLGTSRLISSIYESPSNNDFTLLKKYGITSKIILIRNSFFQNKKFTSDLILNIDVKFNHQEKCKFLIDQINNTHPNKELVFIHIRRGDYVEWPSIEFPAVLPAKWIFEAMDYFRRRLTAPLFLVFADDRPYAIDVFIDVKDTIIMKSENASIDLVLMSLCNFGILSASTFSWWAANLSRKRIGGGAGYDFVAPKFWAGHSQGQWFPPDFYSEWVTYLPVEK